MGEYTNSWENVGVNFDNYLIVISSNFIDNTANKIIINNFRELSRAIGVKNIIAYPQDEALVLAKKIFKIKEKEDEPILIITRLHPLTILKSMESKENFDSLYEKIPIGDISDENQIIKILRELFEYIKSDEYSKITWLIRHRTFNRILKKVKIFAELKSVMPK